MNAWGVLASKCVLKMEPEKESFTSSMVVLNSNLEVAEAMYVRQYRNGKCEARATDDEDVETECVGGKSTSKHNSLHLHQRRYEHCSDNASQICVHVVLRLCTWTLLQYPRLGHLPCQLHAQPDLESRMPDPLPVLHDEDRMPPKMHMQLHSRHLFLLCFPSALYSPSYFDAFVLISDSCLSK